LGGRGPKVVGQFYERSFRGGEGERGEASEEAGAGSAACRPARGGAVRGVIWHPSQDCQLT
jgi:hypothetical protein